MSAIFNAVSMEEFKRISNVEIAHTTWNILQTMHKGTKAVKINKLQQLTSRFESIRMPDNESFDEFYEFDLPKTNKSKSMALKFFDDVDDCEFDDELSSTEIIYLEIGRAHV